MLSDHVLLFHGDNVEVIRNYLIHPLALTANIKVDVVYADCIYESTDFNWVYYCYELLKDNGIFYVQTDQHTVAEYKLLLDDVFGKENYINWLIYIQEWGGTSKRFFPRKHDDILMYAKGKDYKFYPERIQIPKATAGTKFDKKGTGLKTPCDVFYDLGNFSTMSKERIKNEEEKNIKWQKPIKLINRLLLPTTDAGDWVIDPFMGSATALAWCLENDRRGIGIENDLEIFRIAEKRLTEKMYQVLERDSTRGKENNDSFRSSIYKSVGA